MEEQKQTSIDFDDIQGQRDRRNVRTNHRRDIERLAIPAPPTGWRRRLPSPAVCRAVLLALDSFVRNNDAWKVRQDLLADRAGFSDRGTIQRAVAWLAELGYVTVLRTGRGSVYQLNRHAIAAAGAPPSDESSAPIRKGQRPHQKGAAPPSIPTAPASPKPTPTADAAAWGEVGRILMGLGVFTPTVQQLLALLPQQSSLAAVQVSLAHFQEHDAGQPHAGYQAGALVQRLRSSLATDDPAAEADAWPPPSGAWAAHKRKLRSTADQADRQAANQLAQDQAEADRADLQDLERRRGAELDKLPAEVRNQMAVRLFDGFNLERYRRTWQREGSAARLSLLAELESRQHADP